MKKWWYLAIGVLLIALFAWAMTAHGAPDECVVPSTVACIDDNQTAYFTGRTKDMADGKYCEYSHIHIWYDGRTTHDDKHILWCHCKVVNDNN